MKLQTIIKQQKTTWKHTIIIIVVCTVLELGPLKYLMEETGFSERNCYLKCLNRGRDCSASTRFRATTLA